MLYSALMLMMSSAFLMLRLSPAGSFPKPLSAEEESKALAAWKNGDTAARDKLIEHNLRLVAHITKKYYAQCDDMDDLISVGTIGLIKAISTYDTEKKVKLATYASRCIENEILMYLRSMRRRAAEVSLTDALESDEEGGGLALMDILSEESDLDERLVIAEQAQKVRDAVKSVLEEREQQVIRLRYGLSGKPPMTQRETASLLGISRSYISRIEKKALEKLRLKLED
jgi:RNA polymerase sporulation-specific sigma factor